MKRLPNASLCWKSPLGLAAVLLLAVSAAIPADTVLGPERKAEGTTSGLRWSYLHFHAKRLMIGEIDAYVSVRSIPAENVSPPRPAGWSERVPPRQEVLLVTVETRIEPSIGSALRLEDRSWLVAESLLGNPARPNPLLALWQVRSQQGGGDEYEKIYWFTRNGVHRMRKTPSNSQESGRPPEQWSDQKKSFYAYPGGQGEFTAVGTPVALLLLPCGRNRPDSGTRIRMPVFDRKELYDVSIKQRTGGLPDFDMARVEGYPPGKPRTTGIVFEPRSLRGAGGKEFSFLGISGDFEVVFDLDSGIPLKIKGSVPGFGSTELVLQEVRLSSERLSRPRKAVQ